MATTISWYGHEYKEKRQLFLRSYQFSRRQTVVERIGRSVQRFRRMVVRRFRSIKKARRVVWSGLRRHITTSCCIRLRRSFSRHYYHACDGEVVVMEYNAAREWFGTPCHWAWNSTSSSSSSTTTTTRRN